MKKLAYLLAVVCLCLQTTNKAEAQTIPHYTFSDYLDTYTPLSGAVTTHASGSGIDNGVYSVSLPFAFVYDSVSFATVYLSSNGYLTFGSTPSPVVYHPIAGGYRCVSGLSQDLVGLNASTSLTSKVTGTSPNRVFTAQWKNFSLPPSGTGIKINFQISLSEGSNAISVIYDTMFAGITTMITQVGLGASPSYNSRSSSCSWVSTSAAIGLTETLTFSPSCYPPQGLRFVWNTPPACTAPPAPTGLGMTPTQTSAAVSFNPVPAANGYLVVRTPNTVMSSMPVNGTIYAVGNAIGGGTVEYVGSATSFTDAGLTPSTNYRYTVFAYKRNSTCSGIAYTAAPLTGVVQTLGPRAYTWVPATGSGNYNVATNWLPARTLIDVNDTLVFNNGGNVTVTNVPMQTISGLVVSGNTTVRMTSVVNDSLTLRSHFTLASGSALTLGGSNILKIAFANTTTAKTGTIDGTLTLTNSTGYNTTNAVTTITGTVNDSVNASMTTYCGCNTSIFFRAGSVYNHARDGGVVPRGRYDAASQVNITGVTNLAPTFGPDAEVGNLTWDCQLQTLRANLVNLRSVLGDYKIVSTGFDTLMGPASALNVGGDFRQTGGRYRIGASFASKLNVMGDVFLDAGTLDMTSHTFSGNFVNLVVNRHFTQNAGHSIVKTGTPGAIIYFSSDAHQNITANGSIANTRISYVLASPLGATLTGTLPVNNGASNTIRQGNWDGTGQFGYDPVGDTLVYASNKAITASGVEWPALNPPSTVTLRMTGGGDSSQIVVPGARSVPNTIVLQGGILVLNEHDITLTNTNAPTITNPGDTTSMIAADSTGQLVWTVPAFASPVKNYIWPIGAIRGARKVYCPVTATFSANTTLRNIGVRTVSNRHPNDASATNYLDRYYKLTDDGGAAAYTMTALAFRYDADDVVGNTNFRINSWNGASWTQVSSIGGATGMSTTANTPLAGRDFTGRPTTNAVYNWTGAISRDYTVAGNWSPARTTPDASDALFFNSGNTDTVIAVPNGEKVARLVVTNNTSVVWRNVVGGAVTYTITSFEPGVNALQVDAGATFVIANNLSALNIVFGAGGTSYASIAGRLELQSLLAGNTNTINTANSIITVAPSGVLALGITSSSASITGAAANLIINGTYEHKYTNTGGVIPNATWGSGATLLMTGYTTSGGGPNYTIPVNKIVYNCPLQTSTVAWATIPPSADSFVVVTTGTGTLRLAGASLTTRHYLQTGGTVDVNNASLNVSGHFTQAGGTIATAASGTNVGTINFNGTAAQNVSFLNAAPAGKMVYRVSNAAGINLSGTGTLVSNFAINNGGGVRISAPGADLVNTSLSLQYNATASTLTYDTIAGYTASAYTADAIVYPATNGPVNLTVNVGSNSTLTLPFSRTVPGTLTLTQGNVLVGANTLTLGTSGAAPGTLTWVNGYIVPTTGSFERWYTTSGLPTTPGTGVGYYPLKAGGEIRSVSVYFNTGVSISTPGTISVSAAHAPGITAGLSVPDVSETLAFRTNSSWSFGSGSGLALSGSVGARVTAGGLYSYVDAAKLHLMRALSVVGTHVAGTGTAPLLMASRLGMSLADLTTAPFYIGAQDTTYGPTGTYVSVANGNWNSPATWNLGSVPPVGATVYIANGKTVSVNTPFCVAKTMVVFPGSTLTGVSAAKLTVDSALINNGSINIASDTIKLGPDGGGKTTFLCRGNLDISSGKLMVNGNVVFTSGSVFNQTGGYLSVDGRSTSTNSVGSGTPLVEFDTCTVNASGGNIQFIDPHPNAYLTLRKWGNITGTGFTGDHNIVFGDGISASGSLTGWSDGFLLNFSMPVNNIIVMGTPAVTGLERKVTLGGALTMNGDLTLVNTNAKFETSGEAFTISGDINAGAGTFCYLNSVAEFNNPTMPQHINGPGTYANSLTGAVANFASIRMNNGSAGGLYINLPDITVHGDMIFIRGKIRPASGLIKKIAASVAGSTASQSTGWVVGDVEVEPYSATTLIIFPIGDEHHCSKVEMEIAAGAIYHTGPIRVSVTPTDHPAIAASNILAAKSINRYFTIDTSGGLELAAFSTRINLNWDASDADAGIDISNLKVARHLGGTWWERMTAAPTATGISVLNVGNDIAGSYQAGQRIASPFISLQPVNRSVCVGTNTSFAIAASTALGFRWQVNNGSGWENVTAGALYGGVATATLSVTAAPISVTGYQYRCAVYNATDTGYTVPATLVVNPMPVAITGTFSTCEGATTTLANTTGGGTWSSTSASIATVNSAGVVAGINAGTTTISYGLGSGCQATQVVTVLAAPAAITGTPMEICVGHTTTLNCTTPGGSWASTSGLASVDVLGVVSGLIGGNAPVSYTMPNGCRSTVTVTVNNNPGTITGTAAICPAVTTTLSCTPAGGTWASGSAAIAPIGGSTGIVTGGTAGTALVSYILSTGCRSTHIVTVHALPAISGTYSVCAGATTALTAAPSGGTWSSSTPSIGTISASGTVAGIAVGTTTISYVGGTGSCLRTQVVTVNTQPDAITGTLSICTDGSTLLSCATPGGGWLSSSLPVAFISGTGLVAPGLAGTATISYILSTGCYSSAVLTVNAVPEPITGTLSVCVGATTTLSSLSTGGTWSSQIPGIAGVGGSSGVVSGVSGGTSTITYILAGCRVMTEVTVMPLPATISGPLSVCEGKTIVLTNASLGGTWASGTPAVATIGVSSGTVSGIAIGTAIISYTLPTGCFITRPVTVNPMPAAITGSPAVCKAATTTLASATPGGSWSSNAAGIATIGAATGVVSGINHGSATISYAMPTGCVISRSISVDTLPVLSVVGDEYICVGTPRTYFVAIAGGTWSTSNTAVATVSGSGSVSGVSGGTVSISYAFTNVCGTNYSFKPITVYTEAQCDSILSADLVPVENVTMELFPDPNNGVFSTIVHTRTDVDLTMNIIDQVGRQVWQATGTSNKKIEVSIDLPPGGYTFIAHSADGRYFARFVVR